MKQLLGTVIHIAFDVYEEEGHLKSLSKGRETKSRKRKIKEEKNFRLTSTAPRVSE